MPKRCKEPTKEKPMNTPEEEYRQINIRLTDAEIAAVRDLTKVDAVATAVVAIVRKAIENKAA